MQVVDVSEWTSLGQRLINLAPGKFDRLLGAVRKIVEAHEVIASFDWQLFIRGRPSKRYEA